VRSRAWRLKYDESGAHEAAEATAIAAAGAAEKNLRPVAGELAAAAADVLNPLNRAAQARGIAIETGLLQGVDGIPD
jgi:hypothetical protein